MKPESLVFIIAGALLLNTSCDRRETSSITGAAHTERKTMFAPGPLNLASNNVGPRYYGNDIFQLKLNLQRALKKDEFESTQAYKQRVSQFLAGPVLEHMGVKDVFAFVPDIDVLESGFPTYECFEPYLKYDADTQMFSVRIDWGSDGTILTAIGDGITAKRNDHSARTYRVATPPEKARDTKLYVKYILIGNLKEPWLVQVELPSEGTEEYSTQTRNLLAFEPSQLWLFNDGTGEVIAKFNLAQNSGSSRPTKQKGSIHNESE